MDGCADEESSPGPAVNVVEFLVPVAGEEKRDDGVLGSKEENDGKLGEGKESYV